MKRLSSILTLVVLAVLTGCSRSTRLVLHYEGLQSDTVYLSVASIGKPIGEITDTVVLHNGEAQHTFTADEPLWRGGFSDQDHHRPEWKNLSHFRRGK